MDGNVNVNQNAHRVTHRHRRTFCYVWGVTSVRTSTVLSHYTSKISLALRERERESNKLGLNTNTTREIPQQARKVALSNN